MQRMEAAHRFDVRVERGLACSTATADGSQFWPGYVRLQEGSRWAARGETARLVTRLLARERQFATTLRAYEPNRLVTYTSIQPSLPDAYHERHVEADGDGFVYRLVVELWGAKPEVEHLHRGKLDNDTIRMEFCHPTAPDRQVERSATPAGG